MSILDFALQWIESASCLSQSIHLQWTSCKTLRKAGICNRGENARSFVSWRDMAWYDDEYFTEV